MAITKIWTIRARLDKSLNYIANPEKTEIKPDIDAEEGAIKYITNKDKTEQCKYVTAYGCTADKPYSDMMETMGFFTDNKPRKNGVVAYHIVQSFKSFETTPEIAHKCGRELVERVFADKYECVLATHLDHSHLHNHIIINATSFVDGKKYRNSFKDYFIDIRRTSDEICRENCLSVIEQPKRRGMHYAEWKALKEGRPTIRGQVREEIDQMILSSYTMKEFWKIFEERGYRIHRQGENIKYTSFVPACGKKPMRFQSLGEGYSIEDIQNRITAQRNGIRTATPSEIKKQRVYKLGGCYRNLKPIKLKGFKALYFHYLYFFKIIRKKQTPQRVSFFMRDELIKLDRYQKQFKFLFKNNIETGNDLANFKKAKEEEINELAEERKELYASKTKENGQEIKEKTEITNERLRLLRVDLRMCTAIVKDSYKISEKQKRANALLKQAEKEMNGNEYKRRGR